MWLAHVEGANHREIAASLRLREGSIRVMLFRARGKLLQLLRVPAKAEPSAVDSLQSVLPPEFSIFND